MCYLVLPMPRSMLLVSLCFPWLLLPLAPFSVHNARHGSGHPLQLEEAEKPLDSKSRKTRSWSRSGQWCCWKKDKGEEMKPQLQKSSTPPSNPLFFWLVGPSLDSLSVCFSHE
uniref:Secreted protein n=1 Tax=Opuntia streptacantha TaxID=393608 RepID=A0A7C9CBT9_OPUST